ncbi:hypothetical protein KVT40_005873 [Elsinoe batatas]|uniref:A1 cistron-splicing factor n=1 Tax=Elsinoe batatas TaxID=2601811 RepID=A0A8K0L2E0_9PEZI|nr:hypothetical protein KVT40_005873 [Elsinoe batatas]
MDEISPALLLIDLPSKALCGIDLLSFTTTPSFRGIKSLPPGLHFIFTAPHSTLAVRHGSWFSIPDGASSSPPALVLKQWDTTTETLCPVTDPAAILSRRANLGSIWKTGMAPYRQRSGDHTGPVSSTDPNSFPGLTSSITADYLSHVFTSPQEHWHLTSYTDTFSSNSALPSVPSTQTYEPEPPLHLLPIDLRRTWPSTATGRERTEAARDRSWYLLDLCSHHPPSAMISPSQSSPAQSPAPTSLSPVLAELQFTFLTSLTLNNFATLEQWRHILRLVLTCRTAIPLHSTFFVSFLSTLQAQMQRLGTDSLLPDPPTSHATPVPSDPSTRRHKSLEDQSEDELLQYDLPIRGASTSRSTRALRRAADDMAQEAEEESRAMASAAQGAGDDELRTLFLEEEVDGEGRSFLVGLLVGFRKGLESLLSLRFNDGEGGAGGNGEGKGADGVKDVLAALRGLEGTLFELYGWEFDDVNSYPVVSGGVGHGDGGVVGRFAEDGGEDQDDEDGEYAPAFVELTQEQMDELGIEGTPGIKHVDRKARREELGTGEVSQVVVEESDEEGEDEGGDGMGATSDEEYETMDIEDMDARF